MQIFKRIAQSLEPYQRLIGELRENKSPILMVGASDIHKAHLIHTAADDLSGSAILITHDEPSARVLVENINAMAGEERAVLFPERDLNLRQQHSIPQGPMPPTILALSLSPICLNSMRQCSLAPNLFKRSRKSTL